MEMVSVYELRLNKIVDIIDEQIKDDWISLIYNLKIVPGHYEENENREEWKKRILYEFVFQTNPEQIISILYGALTNIGRTDIVMLAENAQLREENARLVWNSSRLLSNAKSLRKSLAISERRSKRLNTEVSNLRMLIDDSVPMPIVNKNYQTNNQPKPDLKNTRMKVSKRNYLEPYLREIPCKNPNRSESTIIPDD